MSDASNPLAEAAALFRRGEVAAARQLAEAALAKGETGELRHLAGVSACRLGDIASGVEHLRRAAELRPEDPSILLMLMRALIDSDRPGEVLRLGFDAEVMPPRAVLELWRTRGEAAHRAGEDRLEAEALERVVAIDPADARTRESLVQLLTAIDRPDDALAHLDQLPKSAAAGRARVAALIAARRFGEAVAVDRAALADDPADREAWLSLVLLADQQGDADEIDALVVEAKAAGFDPSEIDYARAIAAKRCGDEEAALQLAEGSEVRFDPSRPDALVALLADRLGDADKAFAAAARVGRATPDFEGWRKRAAAHRQKLERMSDALTPEWVAGWTSPPPLSRPSPVFLVGFPRSGTTLLDTFLMGHPGVIIAEEGPMLDRASSLFGDIAHLDRATPEEIEQARAAYYEELDRLLPDAAAGNRIVIDKLPLALTGVPLIRRLFSDARFIFARRHPADSVLSNFLQSFQLNDGMANFLDIEDAAKFYDVAMSLWFKAREAFDLDVREVVYEELVEDQEAVLRPLVEWLKLDWRPKLLDHRSTAERRGVIITPSYDQVTKPIHRRAAGRWQRYAAQLAPVLPLLDPWARRLGYDSIAVT